MWYCARNLLVLAVSHSETIKSEWVSSLGVGTARISQILYWSRTKVNWCHQSCALQVCGILQSLAVWPVRWDLLYKRAENPAVFVLTLLSLSFWGEVSKPCAPVARSCVECVMTDNETWWRARLRNAICPSCHFLLRFLCCFLCSLFIFSCEGRCLVFPSGFLNERCLGLLTEDFGQKVCVLLCCLCLLV